MSSGKRNEVPLRSQGAVRMKEPLRERETVQSAKVESPMELSFEKAPDIIECALFIVR